MMFVASVLLQPGSCVVVVIDLQAALVASLDEGDRVIARTAYLLNCAETLGVPVLTTTQAAARLGGVDPRLNAPHRAPFDKLSFSCMRDPAFRNCFMGLQRPTAVLCGAETHICVSLTALELLEHGIDVVVCPDGVGASSLDRHKLGMERMRDAGVVPVHTEAVVYEWMAGADHPRFREILAFTKSAKA